MITIRNGRLVRHVLVGLVLGAAAVPATALADSPGSAVQSFAASKRPIAPRVIATQATNAGTLVVTQGRTIGSAVVKAGGKQPPFVPAPRDGGCYTDTYSAYLKGFTVLGKGLQLWRVTLKKTWCRRGNRIVRQDKRVNTRAENGWQVTPDTPKAKTKMIGRSRGKTTVNVKVKFLGGNANLGPVTLPIGREYDVLLGIEFKVNGRARVIFSAPTDLGKTERK